MSRKLEEQHLEECLKVINQNIERYEAQTAKMSAEIQDMYERYHDNDPEIYTELSNTITMNESVKTALFKNKRAQQKPYFGRIDCTENNVSETLYIGKNGVMRNTTDIEVIDWRAPIAAVYYENGIGECSYFVPSTNKELTTNLNLKRTYEIENGVLLDFYDSEVVANDELLTKYLAKNKETVLNEIIATIQKEQNDIIRRSPYHNVIVQGVAGSGKTTVAMHRISYILYNFEEDFRPEKFFVIGSNKMLLNYITGVLPDLDVHGINKATLEDLFIKLLYEDWNPKKYKLISKSEPVIDKNYQQLKGSLEWLTLLEVYLSRLENELIPKKDIYFNDVPLYTAENIASLISENPLWSTQEKIDILNERLMVKIKNQLTGRDYEYDSDEKKAILKQYRNFFGPKQWKLPLLNIYKDFIADVISTHSNIKSNCAAYLSQNKFDVYDLASLLYIKRRLKETVKFEEAAHMVIDEAQDYGVMTFAVLKYVLSRCTFTIMGDISQNINYDSGMNDWEALKQVIFKDSYDYFGILAKSYRNTIEISDFAESVLKHASFQTYKIEPIIRHGTEVSISNPGNNSTSLASTAAETIKNWQKSGYDTIAVICKDETEADVVRKELSKHITIEDTTSENAEFTKGVMVLPIHLTKGLEFDTVLLYNPTEESYPANDANVKLLYVACTRALHELSIVHEGTLSELLNH